MEIRFLKKDVEDILTKYYCKRESLEGKVKIKTSIKKIGLYYIEEAATKV